jgi:tetratricopeptide (TPR) repeat protein
MTKQIILVLSILFSANGFTQNYQEEFDEICQKRQLGESKDFLDKWKKAEPDNPEMYVGLFNYYLIECNSILGNPNFLDGYVIASENDSIPINKILKAKTESDSLFQIAQDYLNEGISKNPDRLDMYIGRSNTLEKRQFYTEFTRSVKSIIERHQVNSGKWLWANNEPDKKTEYEFVNIIQTYINSMFNANNANIKDIENTSQMLLDIYPNNYILLSNVGICKLEQQKHVEAIKYFKKGLKSKPDDMIIRFNLADTYVQLNQIEKAKEYYNYIIENGNEQYIQYAKDILQKLE